jgi:choline-glycine betaine transporter
MLLLLLLDLQEVGYYMQYSVLQLNFHTDAFGQLQTGEGRAVDDNAAATWFMDAWTIFYIGWWVSWAGFVGLFVARISKGRTIRSIVLLGYICPLLYSIAWFGVFGGVGFRQARQAEEIQELGLSLHNNSDYYQSSASSVCYDVPQVAEMAYVTPDGAEKTFTNTLMGVTPVCVLDKSDDQTAWFNVLNSFTYPADFEHGFGTFLTWVSIFSVSVYFVTSSDSGSLIVDHLASNGFEDAHWLQRVFWAFTEGAVVSNCATSRDERTCARLWLVLTA